jgi:hypothetical protein
MPQTKKLRGLSYLACDGASANLSIVVFFHLHCFEFRAPTLGDISNSLATSAQLCSGVLGGGEKSLAPSSSARPPKQVYSPLLSN